MRWAIAGAALAMMACGPTDGTDPDLVPDYKLGHLTGTWQGDSDCAEGRYRIVFDRPIPGTLYLTGNATLSRNNAAGQCVEIRTEPVTAHVAFGGGVAIYWPLQGAPVFDRAVYRGTFTDLRHIDTGSLTFEGQPTEFIPPGQFAMSKR